MQKFLQQQNQTSQDISWGTEQNSFKIKNPSRFSEEVLPKYFKHSNLSSFIRQLNIYDFKKINSEKYPHEYIYSHPFFDKNKPELMVNIYRKVQHFPIKNLQSIREGFSYSQGSQKNSAMLSQKTIKEEIQFLEQKLELIKSSNLIKNGAINLLKASVPFQKSLHSQLSKFLYRKLTQSYQNQYKIFAEKLKNQLLEQSELFNMLYKRAQTNQFACGGLLSKQYSEDKTQGNTTNCYSSSSGGSLNDHSKHSQQNPNSVKFYKAQQKSQNKTQNYILQQNNVNQINSKNLCYFNSENKYKNSHKNGYQYIFSNEEENHHSQKAKIHAKTEVNKTQKSAWYKKEESDHFLNRFVFDLTKKYQNSIEERQQMQQISARRMDEAQRSRNRST